jgi:hypothetical protein
MSHSLPPVPGLEPQPLKSWGNDDLLLRPAGREAFEREDGLSFRVLDWPELRERFQVHDRRANAAKKRSRRLGLTSVILAGFGSAALALAPLLPKLALTPLLPKGIETIGISIGLAATVAGIGAGLWHLFQRNGKAHWLYDRTWTERLRQFYFQDVLMHFDDALLAMRGDVALAAYRQRRTAALEAVVRRLTRDLSNSDGIDNDHTLEHAWLDRDAALPAVPGDSGDRAEDADRLLKRLRQQRLEIQGYYVNVNQVSHPFAAHVRKGWLAATGDIATALVALLAVAGGVALLAGQTDLSGIMLALMGAAGAGGLMTRLLDSGLRDRVEAERYDWYRAAIERAMMRFDAGDRAAKIAVLREFEETSYQELRQFLRSHRNDRFFG